MIAQPDNYANKVLMEFGFTFKGDCKICGGRAWLYERIINGRKMEAKVRKHNDKISFHYKGMTTFGKQDKTDSILINGLKVTKPEGETA